MKYRPVCTSIDDISRMFADCAGKIDYPPDARPVVLRFNPSTQMFRLIVEADSIPDADSGRTQLIDFEIKRTWAPN